MFAEKHYSLWEMQWGKKKVYEKVAFGIKFSSNSLHPATQVIDARKYEILVSSQQTICE